jgi:hypothetical protein
MRVTGYVITRIENPAVREGILTHAIRKRPGRNLTVPPGRAPSQGGSFD